MRDVEIETLRNRIAQLAAEERVSRNAGRRPWLLTELQMRGPAGFNPGRRLPQRRARRLRYPVIEVN